MSQRRVSSKRRLSLTNDDSEKRQRSEDSHISIGRAAVPSRDGNTTPPSAASSTTSSQQQELGPSESASARQGYSSSASSSPASSAGGDGSRTATRPSSGPRAPTWQTDAPGPDQQQWPREQRTSFRAREDGRDHGRDRLDPRDAVPSRPSGSAQHDEHRSPSGGSYTSAANHMVQPPPKTQAAFVGKLYSMLEDEKIRKSGLLHWSQDGTSFVCPNPTEFSKEVLPNYFKHNNWQSFVRQLNMYSFNKVSDLYSTANVDPQAWEFRHPLFRRGEPQLLVSIKRKSNRQNQDNVPHTSANHSTTSPNDDESKPSMWTTAAAPPVPRYSPPTREYAPTNRPYYAQPRPPSRDFDSNNQSPMSVGVPSSHGRQYPHESPINRSDAPYPPSSSARPTNIDTLSGQLATLQDTVNRLYHTINTERAENARTNLELTTHLLRQNQWLLDSSRDLRLPQDVLNRQQAELMQRYKTLQASEMLSSMANSGKPPTAPAASLDERPPTASYDQRPTSSYSQRPLSSYDQRPLSSYGHQAPSPYDPPPHALQPPMGDPRDGRTVSYSSSLTRRPPSPTHDRRPATIDHASNYSPRTYPSHQRPVYADFRYRPPPLDARDRDRERDRDLPPSRAPLPRRLTDPPTSSIDDVADQPKTSLRNLLH